MIQGLVRYPGAGCIVEFMQGNAPQIAWVLEEQNGKKLRLLLPNRRESAMSASRILPWSGPGFPASLSRDEALEKMATHKARREEAENAIDPVELWELASSEMSKASADWFAELLHTDPDVDMVAACAHKLMQCKSHFRFQPPDFEIYPPETVNARLVEQETVQRREAMLSKGSHFFRLLWEAYQKKTPGPTPESLGLDEETTAHLRRLLLVHLSVPDSQEEANLWRGLIKGLPDDPFIPLCLAQSWGLVEAHHNFWLDRIAYDPGDSWVGNYAVESDRLLEQAHAVEASPPADTRPFISIDAPTTRDIDDAFHVEALPGGGWKVCLALACPAAFWTFDSELDKAVRQRASSLYLPEATHHMLPSALGTDAFSLVQGTTRPAFLVTCEVDSDGTLRSCQPGQTTVRVAANLTYDQCEAILAAQNEQANGTGEAAAGENPASPFSEQLNMAAQVAAAHQALRLRQGAVIIERPDLQLTLEEQEGEILVHLEEDTSAPQAHLLVSELMVLANAGLAAWAAERDIPLLHRTQDVTIPPEFGGIWTAPEDIARVARSLAPAVLEVSPRPHAALGLRAYAPSSSPLRRYPDLVNEAQILHAVHEGSPRWSRQELSDLLTPLSLRLDAVSQVQRARPRYWKLIYLQQHVNEWWPAVVTDENDAFVTVNLPREQIIARARRALFSERTYCGQQVEVRLGKIRPLHNDFQLLDVRDI